MAIFQSSVLKKYLKQLDATEVAKAYKKYTKYFHNATIQQNIKDSNEEQYQATFLNELFVKILGFTLNPQPKYNLTTEFKNVKNARKADGAILLKDEALAVIELKGTNTKDLESIRQQAFDYKANQPGCVYVITSNFEKLRFYINNAVDFEEFDLFDLSYNRFEMLYLCLYKEHLLSNLPLKIKEASIHEEEAITKKFYSDYSLFKRELFRDIVKRNLRNPELKELGEVSSKKTLFKKTQKLLDRFLFIFFGEDRGLLPPNSIPKILEDWKRLKDLDAYAPLYSRYKKYFNYLNEGWKGKEHDIFAYNGGLFKPDTVLDTIEIDDELLYKHTAVLTKYDFESQVDVNILGHIFEHSLNEIESVNAEIEGVEFDKQKSKRKKDGVFYTPKYITKYIVDNTVGKLCEEKKAELEILEEEYLKGPKHRAKKTIKKLDEQIQAYRNWLLTLTICDPACGSGAFLNQALEFLIQEHRWVDEMEAKLLGGSIVFQDVENSILENNIYGVDLNDESVEIAKLSLWLRTAQKGRKLTSLNNNIKCGNSLIDSKAVAGDKAFKWEDEFPEVFSKGGFDVVIGNPPYVRAELIIEYKSFLEKNYKSYHGNADLYIYFYELGMNLLNLSGILSYIAPNKWIQSKYGQNLRSYIGSNYSLIRFIDFGEATIFDGVGTFPSISIIHKAKLNLQLDYSEINDLKQIKSGDLYGLNSILIERSALQKIDWVLKDSLITKLLNKLENNFERFSSVFNNKFLAGIKTGSNSTLILTEEEVNQIVGNTNEKKLYKKIVFGKNIKKYELKDSHQYVFFPYEYIEGKQTLLRIEDYPNTLNYFKQHFTNLTKRAIIKEGVVKGTHSWYELQQVNKVFDYNQPKIIYPDIAIDNRFTIDTNGIIPDMTCFFIPNKSKAVLPILNSKMFKFLASNYCPILGNIKDGGRIRYKSNYLAQIPFPHFQSRVSDLEIFAVQSESIRKSFSTHQDTFVNFLIQKFDSIRLSHKLQSWYTLDFSDFIKELNKAIKKAGGEKLSKMDEMEWMELFETKKKEALELKAQIDRTDREIDGMVYELYGLTDEEIVIVENS